MTISNHARSRLEERFSFGGGAEEDIISLVSNKRAYDKVKGRNGHRLFMYKNIRLIAVVKDKTILTFKYVKKENWEMEHKSQNEQLQLSVTKTKKPKVKKMSIVEIATALYVSPETVRANGKGLFPFEFRNGVKTYLNEAQVTAIKLTLDKHHNLQTTLELPKTALEKEMLIQQAMMFQNEKIATMQEEINGLQVKADIADKAIRDETTQYSIRDAGKHLCLRQGEMFALLRDKRLLTTANLPTQRALDYNVLTVKTNIVNGTNRPQAVMTMQNIYEFNTRYVRKVLT